MDASSNPLGYDDGGPGPGGHLADTSVIRRFMAAFPAKRVAWRTAQLRDAGFGDRSVRRLVVDGTLVRLRQGCYVRGSYWSTLSETGRQRMRVILHNFGTLDTSGRGYVYSHASAARLHGLYLWQADTHIHVTQPGKRSATGVGKDTAVHARALAVDETVVIDHVRATSLERTVIDCCLSMSYRQALILTDHALRLGASLAKLLAVADTLRAHRGIRTLRRVLQHADPRSESPGETLTRDLLRQLNIEAPDLQVWIPTREGRYRADFAWARQRVVLEFDGRSKYFDYRPTDEALLRERQRETALIEAGWKVVRIRWKDLFDEAAFKARILAVLGR